MADLFVLRVIKRGSGVKNCLLCIVEQLWNVFQVLRRALEREKQQQRIFQCNYLSNLKSQIKCACANICVKHGNHVCVCVSVLRCVQTAVISRHGYIYESVQPHLNTCLNLRELVHDGKNGFHWAPRAQIGLVSHKDDGNSDTTYGDRVNTTLSWFVVYKNDLTGQVILQYKI